MKILAECGGPALGLSYIESSANGNAKLFFSSYRPIWTDLPVSVAIPMLMCVIEGRLEVGLSISTLTFYLEDEVGSRTEVGSYRVANCRVVGRSST